MSLATAVELWRYPVKSMAGERLDATEVGLGGIPGDRAFAVADQRTGKVLTAKREPRLLEGTARWVGGSVTLALPGLGELPADDPAVPELLSAWLDRDVRLARPVAGQRATLEADDGDFQSPAGSFFDSRSALHLLTDASLTAAARLHPDGDWDPRRFRPNLLLSADGDGFVEDDWAGYDLHIGDSAIHVRKPTSRCVLPTHRQYGLPPDQHLLRILTREHSSNLGIYANPTSTGRIATGDPVRAAQ